jgi:single-strand DNA-binding protein
MGYLANDPEIKTTKNHNEIAVLLVLTPDCYKTKEGAKVDTSETHRVTVFKSSLVEMIKNYLRKDDMIYIEGSLVTTKWENLENKPQYRINIEVKNFDHILKYFSKKEEELKESSLNKIKNISNL